MYRFEDTNHDIHINLFIKNFDKVFLYDCSLNL